MIRWRPTLPRPPPEINADLGHYPNFGRKAGVVVSFGMRSLYKRADLRRPLRAGQKEAGRFTLSGIIGQTGTGWWKEFHEASEVSWQSFPAVLEAGKVYCAAL